LAALFILLVLTGSACCADASSLVGGFSGEEALRLGEKMYREGILPSGRPMEAMVMGDIPVDGRMFTCDDCHQRSGLGSTEGTVITWPTNARELSKPRRKTGAWRPPPGGTQKPDQRKSLPSYWQIDDARPAYTEESLATLLWTGVDPAGRQLDPIMPRYHLEDRDMAVLIHYLNNLSAVIAPGVDDRRIRFATVVADDAPAPDREVMLTTLQAHIDAHNAQNRHQERRSAAGPFYKSEMQQSYRRLELAVWELKGPQATWPGQLESYYRQDPVFALLGGISAGSWQPVHEFCEQNRIPAIFPLTDLPVVSESDWYTLYFSKGLYQEGETAARYLHSTLKAGDNARVVQVSRPDEKNQAVRKGFASYWHKFGRPPVENIELEPGQRLTEGFWADIMHGSRPAVLLLWLTPADLDGLEAVAREGEAGPRIFLSSGLLDNAFATVPDVLRDNVYLTYRYNLPEARGKRQLVVERWLQARNIPAVDPEMQAKIYFLGWMLTGALKHMRSEYFREYFLEGFDMMSDQDYAIAVFPRLTFGPGQRYASKGGYIARLTRGGEPRLLQASEWVIH